MDDEIKSVMMEKKVNIQAIQGKTARSLTKSEW